MSTCTCSYTAPSDAFVQNRNIGIELKLMQNSASFENNYGTDSLDLIPAFKDVTQFP